MANPFPPPTDLDAILSDIWSRWGRGVADRRSPLHTPVVGSVSPDGAPDQRVMVLRAVCQGEATFRFHTDARSAKVGHIAGQSRASIIGYDPAAKIQIRASGIAAIETVGTQSDAAWQRTSLSGRRCYLADPAPGSVSAAATSGLPSIFESTMPNHAESEAGRANFAILLIQIDRFEWLYLASSGHRRAAFTRQGDNWHSEWLVP